MIEFIMSVIFLAFDRGAETGKWGCLTAIGILFFIIYIYSKLAY